MTERDRIRVKCTLGHAFYLSLRVAVDGWTMEAGLSLMGLGLALYPTGIGGEKS